MIELIFSNKIILITEKSKWQKRAIHFKLLLVYLNLFMVYLKCISNQHTVKKTPSLTRQIII